MPCPRCGRPAAAGASFCQACGAALGEAAAPGEADANPRGVIRVGDMTITVEGDLVPVANVELGPSQIVYFEHHILLWKQPEIRIAFRSRRDMARRFFAGMPIFLSEARGPGNLAVSRESVGQVVALPLGPGQAIDVREHQFLLATGSVEYGSAAVGGGVATALFTRPNSRGGLYLDRFTGRGEGGLVLLHGYGNVFEKLLAPGEALDVEPGAWLWKDAGVRIGVTNLMGSGHGGLIGALGNAMTGASVSLNRFTGPGRIGIQSMTFLPAEQRERLEQHGTPTTYLGRTTSEAAPPS